MNFFTKELNDVVSSHIYTQVVPLWYIEFRSTWTICLEGMEWLGENTHLTEIEKNTHSFNEMKVKYLFYPYYEKEK